MENSPFYKNKLYKRVYNYSKKYNLYKFLGKIGIILGANTLFGILIYFSIDFLKDFDDKKILILFITIAIIINYLINLALEEKELKRLKKQDKIYAHTFIKLQDEHEVALKDIHARDQFLSIVSHELKTPLTIMLLKLHSMKNSIQNVSLANFSIQELMNVLENSEKQIKWLTVIINDLLDVSLITTGKINLQPTETDLVNITKQVKQSFSEVTKKGKYKIEINADSSVVGKWDTGRIEQVITNLFSNAIKFGEGKPIIVKIFKSSNKGIFSINNQGIVIPQQEQKTIFDLFKRASGPGKNKKGLGVGLFIISQIVMIHGGKIKVASLPEKGTTFTIELPLNKK